MHCNTNLFSFPIFAEIERNKIIKTQRFNSFNIAINYIEIRFYFVIKVTSQFVSMFIIVIQQFHLRSSEVL